MFQNHLFKLILIFAFVCIYQSAAFAQILTVETREEVVARLLARAISLEKDGKTNEAIAAFTEVLKYSPNNFEALQYRSYLYRRTNRIDLSILDNTTLIELWPDEFAFWANRALDYIFLNNYQLALRDANQAIALKPGNERLLVMRADINLGLGDLASASTDLEANIKAGIATSLTYSTKSVLCFRQYDTDCLISMSNKVIELDPEYAAGHNNRGYGLILTGKLDEALKSIMKARELSPDWSYPVNNVALIHVLRKDWPKAAAELEIAKQLSPMAGEIYLNQGLMEFKQKRMDDALVSFSKAIEVNPILASAYLHRARVYFKKGKNDLAFEDINAAIRLNPRSFQSLSLRSKIHKLQGRRSDADKDKDAAIKAEKTWPYNELRIKL